MEQRMGYLIATDHFPADGITDISSALQALIDANPNRTIFFPDGTYLLTKPVLTPADPHKSVDLILSNFAILRAADDWNDTEAMVRLGAKDKANDIYTPGSNYSLTGGIIDGNGKAKAISIDGGRETCIRNCRIKNALIGIHIKHGANNGSSDSDITGVNITGTGDVDSIGVLIEGYDNTLTNMRIANVFTGVDIRSGGNMLRNIHPLYIIRPSSHDQYEKSVGFRVGENMANWLDYCYSDQFATGYHVHKGAILQNCFCWWYSGKETSHVALRSDLPFTGMVNTLVIGGEQHPEHPNRLEDGLVLSENGVIQNVSLNGTTIRLFGRQEA